jgi:hypothetical protein
MKTIIETTPISTELAARIFDPNENTVNSYAIAPRYKNFGGLGIVKLYVPKVFGRYYSAWRNSYHKSPPEIIL